MDSSTNSFLPSVPRLTASQSKLGLSSKVATRDSHCSGRCGKVLLPPPGVWHLACVVGYFRNLLSFSYQPIPNLEPPFLHLGGIIASGSNLKGGLVTLDHFFEESLRAPKWNKKPGSSHRKWVVNKPTPLA